MDNAASYITISLSDPTVISLCGVPSRMSSGEARIVAKRLNELASQIERARETCYCA